MNIFVTDKDPVISARALDNRRLNKMILESAQLMSNVAHKRNLPNKIYRLAHGSHPCSKWVDASRDNYLWVYEHLLALISEYNRWTNKKHSIIEALPVLRGNAHFIEVSNLQEFQNSSMHKEIKDTMLAYKITMEDKWSQEYIEWAMKQKQNRHAYKPTWRTETQPLWVKDLSIELETKSMASALTYDRHLGGEKNSVILRLQSQKV